MRTLPCKIMEQCRLCPAKSRTLSSLPRNIRETSFFAPRNSGALQTLLHKIMESSFFAPQNYGAFILCPTKLWSNADFAPQNHRDIVSGAKITTEIILKVDFFSFFSNYFCKSMLFQRSIQPWGPIFKEQIFCVTLPLRLLVV